MKTISSKISFSIATCSIIVSMLLGFLIYIQSEKVITQESERHLLSVLNGEAAQLNAELSRVKQLSFAQRSVILNTFDYEAAKKSTTYMTSYKTNLSRFIKSLIIDFKNVSAWMLFNSEVIEGTHTVSYTFEDNTFVRESEYDAVKEGYYELPWWNEAVNHDEYWSEPYYWEPWKSDVVSYSIPVYVDNKLIGVTGAEIFLSYFNEQLKNIKIYESGSVILLTEKGVPIFIPDEIDKTALSNWYTSQKEFLKSNPSGITQFYGSFNQNTIAWTKLSNDWILLAAPKTDEMYASLKPVSLLMLLCLVLSIPLSIIIGIRISRTITRPLGQLTKAAENILKHHSKVEIPLLNSAPNEIKILSKAFSSMQADVKNTLRELSINENKYRSLVENADHLIFTIDIDEKLTTTNKKFEDMFNIPKDSLIGRSFTTLFTNKQSIKFWKKIFLDLKTQKEKVIQETYFIDSHSKKHTLITSLIPVLDSDDKLYMIMGTSTDITDRLNIEVEKNTSLGRLVSGIGHEINTPLGNAITVSGFIESNIENLENNVLDGSLTKENLVNSIERIHSAMESLSINLDRTHTLIENFKNLSVDPSEEYKTKVVLSEIFTLLKINFENIFVENNCKIEFSCAENIVLNSVPSTLLMVLTQLIENAIYHAFSDDMKAQGNAHVWISALDNDNMVSIYVKDNGNGMSKDDVQKIFEPFFTTDRKTGRTGLGLSIVFNSIVNQLDGSISCNSDENFGTIFNITFKKI